MENRRIKGQGLTEYLILMCLVSVAAIAVVSVVGQNLRARYAAVSSALRGEGGARPELDEADEDTYRVRGFDDFMEGAKKERTGRGR